MRDIAWPAVEHTDHESGSIQRSNRMVVDSKALELFNMLRTASVVASKCRGKSQAPVSSKRCCIGFLLTISATS